MRLHLSDGKIILTRYSSFSLSQSPITKASGEIDENFPMERENHRHRPTTIPNPFFAPLNHPIERDFIDSLTGVQPRENRVVFQFYEGLFTVIVSLHRENEKKKFQATYRRIFLIWRTSASSKKSKWSLERETQKGTRGGRRYKECRNSFRNKEKTGEAQISRYEWKWLRFTEIATRSKKVYRALFEHWLGEKDYRRFIFLQ
ncbi:hypothetical protein NPIL_235751 [Nephila pilipes]|uniref:Uncharacterized protein n=1 Tax=Nephila pilipes TaxID=299642 RepID=A0A8X6J069_NEPPI|nr:hypothetical protein NPIL_235751 [Nephila pilipes]